MLVPVLVSAAVAASCATQTANSRCTGSSPLLRQRGTLTVAADLTYPPFAYDRPNDIPAGFEADVLRAVAKQLKMELVVVNRGTSALVPGLLGHRYDLAAAGLIDSEELTDQTCTSVSYLPAELAVVIRAPGAEEEPPTREELDGRPVGVLRASRAEDWTREHMGGSDIRTMAADVDLIEGLEQRTVDAVVEEHAVARYAVKRSKARLRIAEVIDTGRRYVIAAAPDNGALITRVDRALARLESSGKLEKIRVKWFGR